MRIHLVFVGKTSFPEMEAGISRYIDRIRRYAPAEIHTVKAEKIGPKGDENAIREMDADRISKAIPKQGHLVVWDQRGLELDSPGLARFFDGLANNGVPAVWMAIGGPLGLSPRLVGQADTVLSLSKMTFPHDLARLMIVEQIYRAFTILKGEPYHK